MAACWAMLPAGAMAGSFDANIRPILESRCVACHGASAPQGGLDLRSLESLLKGGKSGPAIVPGSAGHSLLVEKLVTKSMPPVEPKLTEKEIAAIRDWIDEGAKGADGKASTAVAAITENDVLPIFQTRCFVCHGKREQKGGLDLRTRASRLKGGKSGPAMVVGNPGESLIVQKIESGAMPPTAMQFDYAVRTPSAAELGKIKQWIAAGAPESPPATAVQRKITEKDRRFWAFQPPQRPVAPRVANQNRVRNPIDAFLLVKLEAKGLRFAPEADKATLLRRAWLDLIGMPPSPAEAREFLNDAREDAYERLIDRLLESPHYGERWGRYWLDLAGYADTEGFGDADEPRMFAWRYRDYVIRAFNRDKPYDEFLVEQLAGDELFDYRKAAKVDQEVVDRLAATGFLRTTPDPTNGVGRRSLPDRLNVISDEVEVLTSSVMGLTIGCARCHDHKYDPIPQRDYYRFSAILQTAYDLHDWLTPSQREIPIAPDDEMKEVAANNGPIEAELKKLEAALEAQAQPFRRKILEERIQALPEAVRPDLLAVSETPPDRRSDVQKYLADKFKSVLDVSVAQTAAKFPEFKAKADPVQKEIAILKGKLKPKPHVRVLMDAGGEPSGAFVYRRGDPTLPGEPVEAGVPILFDGVVKPYRISAPDSGVASSGRRLALARWLTQPDHPLTSRVWVNQMWMRHFGRGIVASPSNFGRSGAPPSHPELLDWLATEFVRSGWSVKTMQRIMMTSSAYRQSSRWDGAPPAADPENLLWSRMPLRRMDAEAVHDSVLRVTGRLNDKLFGPPEKIEIKPDREVVALGSKEGLRRALYVTQSKQTPLTMLAAFDFPQMTPNCLVRQHSTVATQALELMNGEAVWAHARHMAGRVVDEAGDDPRKQVEQVYWRALSRRPSDREITDALESLKEFATHWPARLDQERSEAPKAWTARWLALSNLCHAILNSAEFSYID
ncbi:MAG: DUF1553 domain-containing protein [Bryobacteraceae bacterium]